MGRLHGWVVGAGEDRLAIGRQEHAHRPTTLAGHGLDGVHVDAIDIGPLFAVDLDVHEVVVHVRGRVGILERLVRHDMAPVARRVSDREEDRDVTLLGRGERGVAPLEPIDRVAGMLQQIRARGLGKAIRHWSSRLSPLQALDAGLPSGACGKLTSVLTSH